MMSPCTYCGLLATTRDHVLPQILATSLQLAELEQAPDRMTVPACSECNMLLGARVFPTLAARRNAAHASLAKRYHAVLHAPRWSLEEIMALGPTLRSAVARKQWLREMTLERLSWPRQSVIPSIMAISRIERQEKLMEVLNRRPADKQWLRRKLGTP